MFDKRLNIFTGHFGSGKTEIAVNAAFSIKRAGFSTAIIDMDIVNPFFRTKDAQEALERSGIKVVAPAYANTNVDVPALPAEIYSFFGNKDMHVVMDIGGDDLGARVLSRYKKEIENEDYDMFIVINVKRPETDSEGKIEEMVRMIEISSSLKATGLINNTNLMNHTTVEDVLKGEELISSVSKKLSIPFRITAVMSSTVGSAGLTPDHELLVLDKYIKLPWE